MNDKMLFSMVLIFLAGVLFEARFYWVGGALLGCAFIVFMVAFADQADK